MKEKIKTILANGVGVVIMIGIIIFIGHAIFGGLESFISDISEPSYNDGYYRYDDWATER